MAGSARRWRSWAALEAASGTGPRSQAKWRGRAALRAAARAGLADSRAAKGLIRQALVLQMGGEGGEAGGGTAQSGPEQDDERAGADAVEHPREPAFRPARGNGAAEKLNDRGEAGGSIHERNKNTKGRGWARKNFWEWKEEGRPIMYLI
jgi:hypothetical protein